MILFAFKNKKNKKKSKLTKNKEVEGPTCFGDQATLPINRGHNTHKKREKIYKGIILRVQKKERKKKEP